MRFMPKVGMRKGIFNSIFLAVSAFCNAGFDNFGNDSLLGLQTDVLVNITLALLIITGGLGFMVWFDLATKLGGKQKGLHFHTKVVLLLTAGLLVFGTVTSLWTEYNNPGTIGNLSFGDKLLVSFFQTVSMRTAGFASIDYTAARPVTLFIYLLQMFLGGAPGGTAGGLKITTFLVLLLFARKEILGLPHTNMGRRTLSPQLVQKAFGVTVIFQLTFLLGLLALGLVTDSSHRFIYLIFETVSALATVGVTANITTSLNTAGMIVIMLLMFIGRVGPLTLLPGGLEQMGVSLHTDMRTALKDVDVVIMLRLQNERMRGALLPSPQEYFSRYGLTREKLALAKPDAIVMHPGPMNRGVEIESAVADGPQSVILQQVTFGIAVRMAVMSMLAAG